MGSGGPRSVCVAPVLQRWYTGYLAIQHNSPLGHAEHKQSYTWRPIAVLTQQQRDNNTQIKKTIFGHQTALVALLK